MATYVELRHQPFHKMMKRQLKRTLASRWNVSGIRRPLNGIDIKEETFAYMRIVKEDGEELMIPSENSPAPYANFFIVHWEQQDIEKFLILETLGDIDYFYPFGRKPRQYAITGYLLNSADFNWKAQWLANYDRYLRASQLAKNRARIYLYVDHSVIEGYAISTSTPQDASNNSLVQFAMSILVTDFIDVDSLYFPQPQPGDYVNGLPGDSPQEQTEPDSPVKEPEPDKDQLVDWKGRRIHPSDTRTLWRSS